MNISIVLRWLTVVSITQLLTACMPVLDPRWKMIKDSSLVTEELKTRTCLKVKQKSLQLATLKALFSVDINDGQQSLRLSVAFKAPDQVRLEVLPPNLAMALSIATVSKNNASLLDLSNKNFSTYQSSSKLLDKLFDIDLPVEDLAYILSARVPLRLLNSLCSDKTEAVAFKNAPDGYGVSIEDRDSGAIWTVNLSTGLLRTVLLRKGPRGWPIISSDFTEDDFMETGNEFPKTQFAVIGSDAAQIKIHTIISKINSPLKDTVFQISVPEGFVKR